MFSGHYNEVTTANLIAKSGAPFAMTLVQGDLVKFGREHGEQVEIKCTHGVRVGMREYNFVNKKSACDFFARVLAEKIYSGYTLAKIRDCHKNG